MKWFSCVVFASALLSSTHLNSQEIIEAKDESYLFLPEDHYIPFRVESKRRTSPQGFEQYFLEIQSKAFHLEAPTKFKGWRMQQNPSSQVVIYNIHRNDARVTLSLFNSLLFRSSKTEKGEWEDAYLNAFIFKRSIALETDPDETFPDLEKPKNFLLSEAPRAVLDYQRTDLATKQVFYCRDYFIDYRLSTYERYTLLVQFQRPEDLGSSIFQGVFKSLHAVEPVKTKDE